MPSDPDCKRNDPGGAHPVEKEIDCPAFVEELKKRGIPMTENITDQRLSW